MKIYTRTGDTGTTSLVGGTRVEKDSVRLEAYGTIDELNSHIGLLLALPGIPEPDRATLTATQHLLFNLGALLATEPESKYQPKGILPDHVTALEQAIDRADAQLPGIRQFILPAGTQTAAQANVARTVARRAERRMITMTRDNCPIPADALQFINRLSDYLFILSRLINHLSASPETFWDADPKF